MSDKYYRRIFDKRIREKPVARGAVLIKGANRVHFYLLLMTLLLLASSLLGCSLLDKTYRSDKTEDYESFLSKASDAEFLMPSTDDLGKYEDVVFGYKNHVVSVYLLADSDGVSVFVSYNKEHYEEEKEKVLTRYAFLTEPLVDRGNYTYPVASFDYNGYSFRITAKDHHAPKSFMMVGVNDEKMKIAYLYYYDVELDYLAEGNADEAKRIAVMQNLFLVHENRQHTRLQNGAAVDRSPFNFDTMFL